ncbi:MAG: short-chain dehydrogenase [Bacteroidetes bacterium]|nr:MAG: short-chain dehydrogenase [Bacteroidota bacterium]
MHSPDIANIVEKRFLEQEPLKVEFKTRQPIIGLFIKFRDYDELKAKNFWRIVPEARIKDYKKTQDFNLSRIFNGQELTKLTIPK